MSKQHQWSPNRGSCKPIAQAVVYPDRAAAENVLTRLARLPPLVTSWEVETLKRNWPRPPARQAIPAPGRRLLRELRRLPARPIAGKLKILLKMSLMLVFGGNEPVIRVGRFAGQYAKPRSSDTRNPQWRDAAQLSRRHDQSPRLHRAKSARPIPNGCCAATSGPP